ncbi:MAG: hypothetical protein GY754_24250 [bacterium]|nr:hypothetical protein [bacterium]
MNATCAAIKANLFFVFEAANNSGLLYDVSAVISGTSISAELPYGTGSLWQ